MLFLATFVSDIIFPVRHTYKSYNKDAKEDPEGVADDVHDDDGGEGDGKAHLSQALTTLSPAEDVPGPPEESCQFAGSVDYLVTNLTVKNIWVFM